MKTQTRREISGNWTFTAVTVWLAMLFGLLMLGILTATPADRGRGLKSVLAETPPKSDGTAGTANYRAITLIRSIAHNECGLPSGR